MDFEEFLWAKGYGEEIAAEMLEHMLQEKPFHELEMTIYQGLFLDYSILGGMPRSSWPRIIRIYFADTGVLIPVEVKATNGRSKSLRVLIESDRYPEIHWGIKFTGGNVGYSDKIYTFPYFCAYLLKRYVKGKSEKI